MRERFLGINKATYLLCLSLMVLTVTTSWGQKLPHNIASDDIKVRVVDEKGNSVKGVTVQIIPYVHPCDCSQVPDGCFIKPLATKVTTDSGWAIFEGQDFDRHQRCVATINARCEKMHDCDSVHLGPACKVVYYPYNAVPFVTNEIGGYDKGILLSQTPVDTSAWSLPRMDTITEYFNSLPPKVSIEGGFGYGMSFNGGLLGEYRTFMNNSLSFEGVYGSWGAGMNFYLRPMFRVCRHVAAGAELSYVYGKTYDWTTNTTGSITSLKQSYQGRYMGASIAPSVMFYPCHSDQWTPYLELGLPFNFYSSIKQSLDQTQTNNSGATETRQEGKLKGTLSIGFSTSFGVKYKLSDKWFLGGELNLIDLRFIPDKFTTSKYVVNGVDKLDSLPIFLKETDYVKSYTTQGSSTNPNGPAQQLRNPQPGGSFGMRLGISYAF